MRVGLMSPGLAVPGLLGASKYQAVAARLDSLWLPDHVIGALPRSLYTKNHTALARVVKNSDACVEPFSALGYLVHATRLSRLGLGVAVTDVARRHPVVVAQAFASMQILSRGRMRLGLGTGVSENSEPFGIDQSRAVARLEEGLAVIRALWDSHGQPVDRDGEFFPLKRALLDIPPYRGTRPPILVGAQRPRMLAIAGRYGDGWMPLTMRSPELYAEGFTAVRSAAADAGRDPALIAGSGMVYVMTASSPTAVDELLDSPLPRTLALHLPASEWARAGGSHPLGSDFNGELLPHLIDEQTALAWASQVPDTLLKEVVFAGTPDQLAEQLRGYGRVGLTHPIVLNVAMPQRPKLILAANTAFDKLLRTLKRI